MNEAVVNHCEGVGHLGVKCAGYLLGVTLYHSVNVSQHF
jgi:hypothetical protein